MSMFDGLLLDAQYVTGVRREIWFANRTDGATGSGTESDPFEAKGTVGDLDPTFDYLLRKSSRIASPRQ